MTLWTYCARHTARGAAACAWLSLVACGGKKDGPVVVEPPTPVALTVTVAGATADGQVTSSPAGITCTLTNSVQSGTCTAAFARGTAVTLSASPSAGSTFGVWSGDCGGSSTTCAVTLSSATSAGAAFAPIPVAITTTTLAGGTVGSPYAATLVASGGDGTFAWSVTTGALPPGLALNATTGAITGTPTTAGTTNFSVTATSRGRPAVQALSIAVIAVVSGTEFSVLSVGATSSCAIANTVTAPVYCWGSNTFGEMGLGSTDIAGRATPTMVPLPTTLTYRRVSVGDAHACALATSGALYCWGRNTSGQVGTGVISANVATPTLIAAGTAFTEVTAGGGMTCAIVESTREGRCWGNNEWGQLGDGTRVDRLVPTPITGGMQWNTLSAGSKHACGLQVLSPTDVGGRVRCWGRNLEGQVGDGTAQSVVITPSAVDVSVLYLRISASVLGDHTCGIDAAGALKCWGFNNLSQLGDGTTVTQTTPRRIGGTRQFVSVAVMQNHGCAADTGGLLFFWGENQQGVLGDGTTINRTTPVAVSQGTETFRSIATGSQHTCALGGTSVSRVQCWGVNVQGQLGSGSFSPSNSTTPVVVRAP